MDLSSRERFLRTLDYKPVDRVPYHSMGLWPQTLERWMAEGLPQITRTEYLVGASGLVCGSKYFGLDRWAYIDIRLDAQPHFKERVIEETDRYKVFIDPDGATQRIIKDDETLRGLRGYIDHPVKTRDDWIQLKKRFDPATPSRYPAFWEEEVTTLKDRDYPTILPMNSASAYGLYSFLRRGMGTEEACVIFYDDPTFAEELLDFYTDFTMETIHRCLHEVEVDCFNIFEDMAGKGGPLVSPSIFKQFLRPRYKRIIEFLNKHGVKWISMDSDGDMWALIPLLIESGINILWPMEIASGMEPLEVRKKFGRDLRLWGGLDKRVLSGSRKDIEHEVVRKVPALLEDGGYIPFLDHDPHPDIPLDGFYYYLEILRRAAEGRYGA